MAKQITIHTNEVEVEEGIFLINPQWIHLDEKEIQEALKQGQKIFKVNFQG